MKEAVASVDDRLKVGEKKGADNQFMMVLRRGILESSKWP